MTAVKEQFMQMLPQSFPPLSCSQREQFPLMRAILHAPRAVASTRKDSSRRPRHATGTILSPSPVTQFFVAATPSFAAAS